MRVALLCGSFGPTSANLAALRATESALIDRGDTVVWVDGLGEVPAFRADLVDNPPL